MTSPRPRNRPSSSASASRLCHRWHLHRWKRSRRRGAASDRHAGGWWRQACPALMPRECQPTESAAAPSSAATATSPASRTSSWSSTWAAGRMVVARRFSIGKPVRPSWERRRLRVQLKPQHQGPLRRLLRGRAHAFFQRLARAAYLLQRARQTGRRRRKLAASTFHTIDSTRYWDERSFLRLLADRNRRHESRHRQVMSMRCASNSATASVNDEPRLHHFGYRRRSGLIHNSWRNREGSLYGQLGSQLRQQRPAKLLEYNTDTPTSIYEAAVFPSCKLRQGIERHLLEPRRRASSSSLHELLIEAWRERRPRVQGMLESPQRTPRRLLLSRTPARQPASDQLCSTSKASAGARAAALCRSWDEQMTCWSSKLYPWEWMFHDAFAKSLRKRQPGSTMKTVSSPREHRLTLCGDVPGHPNLSTAFFEGRTERQRPQFPLLRPQTAAFSRRRDLK